MYGPETPPLVREEAALEAHTLNYAVQKAEADGVVRFRPAAWDGVAPTCCVPSFSSEQGWKTTW